MIPEPSEMTEQRRSLCASAGGVAPDGCGSVAVQSCNFGAGLGHQCNTDRQHKFPKAFPAHFVDGNCEVKWQHVELRESDEDGDNQDVLREEEDQEREDVRHTENRC